MLDELEIYSRIGNIIYHEGEPIIKLKQNFINIEELTIPMILYMNRYLDMWPDLWEDLELM